MSHLNRSLIRLVPLALIIVCIIGAIGPSPVRADPGWYDVNWQYRKKITINSGNVSGNLSNFPVLISIVSDSDIGSHAQLDGDDILFTQGDEVSKIPHEIESFSSNGATANLTAWVKIPNLSSTADTDIYIYYGYGAASNQENPTNVWDNSFKMVQHLHETSGTHYDSTQFNNDGTPNIDGSGTQNASGQINGADSLDGTNDYINCGNGSSLNITSNITIEAWIRPGVNFTNTTYQFIDKRNGGIAPTLLWHSANHLIIYAGGFAAQGNTASLTADTWYYVVGVAQDGTTNNKVYINGTDDTAATNNATFVTNSADLVIGSTTTGANYFNGIIDEVRISNTARSADWIQTSYNNQSNPSAFFTLGSEQNAPAPVAVGGKILIVNKAMVLAPWILIAIALCIVIIRLIQHFRKKASSRSPHQDTP